MSFQLVVKPPRGPEARIYVDHDEVMIGRGIENDVVLRAPLASRRHCRIFSAAGRILVEDLGSQNGTYVCEQLVSAPQELLVGDTLRIVTTEIVLEAATGGEDIKPPMSAPIDPIASAADTLVDDDDDSGPDSDAFARARRTTGQWEAPPVRAAPRVAVGRSPLVTYAGETEGRALGEEAALVSFDEADYDDSDDDNASLFTSEAMRTDPNIVAPRSPATNPANRFRSVTSQAGVPEEAREIRATLFGLFLRAVRRDPPGPGRAGRAALREKVQRAIPVADERLAHLDTSAWAAEIVEELCGYGPLTPLLANPNVTSVVVDAVAQIRIQRGGQLVPVGSAFTSVSAMKTATARLLSEVGGDPDVTDETRNYRLPSGLEVVLHRPSDDVSRLTVVKPANDDVFRVEARLNRRAAEVAEAIALAASGEDGGDTSGA